jgi:hypothetical protein
MSKPAVLTSTVAVFADGGRIGMDRGTVVGGNVEVENGEIVGGGGCAVEDPHAATNAATTMRHSNAGARHRTRLSISVPFPKTSARQRDGPAARPGQDLHTTATEGKRTDEPQLVAE